MIELDASGRYTRNILSKFGQGAFYVYNTSVQAIPNGYTNTVMAIDTKVIDVCTWFTTPTFTPKQPGYYLLFGKVYVEVTATFVDATTNFYLWVRKNSAAAIPADSSVTLRRGVQLSYVALAESNGTTDTFDLCVSHNGTGDIDCNHASFGGVFVSYNNP